MALILALLIVLPIGVWYMLQFTTPLISTKDLYEYAKTPFKNELDTICRDINRDIINAAHHGRHHIAYEVSSDIQNYYDKDKDSVESYVISFINIRGEFRATVYKNFLGIYWYE